MDNTREQAFATVKLRQLYGIELTCRCERNLRSVGQGNRSISGSTRRIGFADRPITSEITHLDPPKTWGIKGVDGPIRARVDVMVEPLADSRSRLTITIDFEGHGVGRILVPLIVVPEARKEMPVNLAKLRQQLESSAWSP